ncbi:MAG: hypothetical protein EA401_05680, partial [Planctomycetota bacterium]
MKPHPTSVINVICLTTLALAVTVLFAACSRSPSHHPSPHDESDSEEPTTLNQESSGDTEDLSQQGEGDAAASNTVTAYTNDDHATETHDEGEFKGNEKPLST